MYRLALSLGRVDVDTLASEISSPQLTELLAYERLEPFAADRIDANAAMNRWQQYRTNGGTKANPGDFRLVYGRTPKVETPAEMVARIKAGFANLSSTYKRGNP